MSILSTGHGRFAVLAIGLLALSGCGGARSLFGLERNPPDEFRVVRQAPLQVPANLSLPPPAPGTERPQEQAVIEQAAQTVFGTDAVRTSGGTATSRGEMALLNQAGTEQVPPNIRSIVNREAAEQIEQDKSWIDTLLFWREPLPPGTIVDPKREAQRLRENAALGKPVTEGQTPIIERRRKAPLEGLFQQ